MMKKGKIGRPYSRTTNVYSAKTHLTKITLHRPKIKKKHRGKKITGKVLFRIKLRHPEFTPSTITLWTISYPSATKEGDCCAKLEKSGLMLSLKWRRSRQESMRSKIQRKVKEILSRMTMYWNSLWESKFKIFFKMNTTRNYNKLSCQIILFRDFTRNVITSSAISMMA